MATTAPDARRPLTATTWADLPHGLLASQQRLGWEAEADLAHQLAEVTHLTGEQARDLVSLAAAGLPLILTWRTRLNDERGRPGCGRVETTRATVLVTQVQPPLPHTSYPGEVRVRYTGFGHGVYLSQIVDVQVPQTERTYSDPDEG